MTAGLESISGMNCDWTPPIFVVVLYSPNSAELPTFEVVNLFVTVVGIVVYVVSTGERFSYLTGEVCVKVWISNGDW